MVARKRLSRSVNKPSYYFAEEADVEFFSSGCTTLDCVLGGGWPIGAISNLVGDRSTGKTLLAIEAAANFHLAYPKSFIQYDVGGGETFDRSYAEYLGLPKGGVVSMEDSGTVEDFFESLTDFLSKVKKGPALYVLDSLDALSDEAELKRKISDGSYGTKAKQFGEILRRLDKKLARANCLLLVVSQIRDNIGVMFGRKHKRSGGKALDFWAAQVVWLAEKSKIAKTRKKIRRTVGINVVAKCEKNKVGLPFRQCEFPLIFNYGMDDEQSCRAFLKEAGVTERRQPDDLDKLRKLTKQRWLAIEREFMPTRRKYE